MQLSDLDQVCAIERAVHGSNCWTRAAFVQELNQPDSAYWVLTNKKPFAGVVGYIGLQCISPEGHITNLSVAPLQQGKGYGEALLAFLVEQAIGLGLKQLTLEVRSGNQRALKLYQKYGFCKAGCRPAYYKDNGEDALILWTPNLDDESYKSLFEKNFKQLLAKFSV
jgi:[ribosomal protein S18]-alanine N-acetyltransferase